MSEERPHTEEKSAAKAFKFPTRTEFETFKKEELLPELKELKEKRKEYDKAARNYHSSSMYRNGLNTVFGIGVLFGTGYLYFLGGSSSALIYLLIYGIFFWATIRYFIPYGTFDKGTARAFLIAAAVPILFFGIFMPLLIYAGLTTLILEVGGRMGYQGRYKVDYIEEYKKKLIERTVKFIDDRFEYEPLGGPSEETVANALVFPFKGKHFLSEDQVTGKVDGTDIAFSEVFISSSHVKNLGGIFFSKEQKENARKQWQYLHKKSGDVMFKGLLFIADFHKEFPGTTTVRPREFHWTREKLGLERGKRGRKGGQKGDPLLNYDPGRRSKDPESDTEMEQVHLEDPDFEERYNVYSTDPVMSRYILSPSMMEQIKTFTDAWGSDIFLSFKGSKMFLAIEEKEGIFNPRLANTSGVENEEEQLDRYFADLEQIFGIVEELRLNDQIWAKG